MEFFPYIFAPAKSCMRFKIFWKGSGDLFMENGNSNPKTSTGLNQNTAALLSYLLGFISGIIFLLIEKENRFVRFHAMQSLITFLALFIISFIAGIIPLIGSLLTSLIGIVQFILWIVLMYKAYKNEMFKLPITGDMAEQQIGRQ